jgi:hypothetical protein
MLVSNDKGKSKVKHLGRSMKRPYYKILDCLFLLSAVTNE